MTYSIGKIVSNEKSAYFNPRQKDLRILNHPRIHELTRIIDLSIDPKDSKQMGLVDSSEVDQINLAVPA